MIDFLSLDQILLVKLKNVSFQNIDLTPYRLQFWTFSNVILHLEQGNLFQSKFGDIDFYFCTPLGAVCSGGLVVEAEAASLVEVPV